MRPVYWRYRTNWRGQLILQCMTDAMDLSGPEHNNRIGMFAAWRDARAEDLTRNDIAQPPCPVKPKVTA